MSVARPGSAPLPAMNTRPSGRSIAVEWYPRACVSEATVVQVSVSGFQISDWSTPLLRVVPSDVERPPLASTVPSASMVRLLYERPKAIGWVERQAGVAELISMTAVPPVGG